MIIVRFYRGGNYYCVSVPCVFIGFLACVIDLVGLFDWVCITCVL